MLSEESELCETLAAPSRSKFNVYQYISNTVHLLRYAYQIAVVARVLSA
jgi:hypothetical protein